MAIHKLDERQGVSFDMLSPNTLSLSRPNHASCNSSPPSQPNKWEPYANAGDFSANMIIAFAVLFCGFLLGLAVNVIIRFHLCARRRRDLTDDTEKQTGSSKEVITFPTLIFSAGTKLIGAEAECAICLADFVEGDRLWVVPACYHGFHVHCVD